MGVEAIDSSCIIIPKIGRLEKTSLFILICLLIEKSKDRECYIECYRSGV